MGNRKPPLPNKPKATRATKQKESSDMKAVFENYNRALENRLKPTLAATCELRDKALRQLAELEQAKRALYIMQKQDCSSQPHKPALEMRVNLGENFFMHAEADQLNEIVLDLGLGIMVEVNVGEASTFIEQRRDMLNSIAEMHTKKVSLLQGIVEGIIKCLSEMQIQDKLSRQSEAREDNFHDVR